MFCYKDRTWCTAKDCVNMECSRNTQNKKIFNPDEFWEKRIGYAAYVKNCKEYIKKTQNKE